MSRHHVNSAALAAEPGPGGGASRRTTEALFWTVLVAGLAWLVAPLWIGPMPPLTDFGGHVQLADAWVRVGDDPFVAQFVTRQGDLWAPNLLAVRFAALLHPLVDVVTGLRLFVTLSMVGLVAGALAILRAFGRSRWLAFLVLPLTWNGMLALGLISYAAAMALMLVAVALARRLGERGGLRDGLGLAAVLVLAFFAHGLGAPLAMAMAGAVLVVTAPTPRRLLWLASFAPAVALWVRWYVASRSAIGLGATSVMRFTLQKSWDELLVNTVDVTHGGVDMGVLAVLVGAWILLLATGGAAAPQGEWVAKPGWRGAARGWCVGAWRDAREHTLLLIGLGLLAGYFFIAPGYIGDTFISPRLIVPAIVLLFLAPRLVAGRALHGIAIAAAVGATFALGADLRRHAAAFAHEEMEPVALLARSIPPRQRVLCAEVFRVNPHFIRSPLDHNCNAVAVASRGAFADGAFADTPYNAVALKDLAFKVRLEPGHWQSYPALSRLDYVIVRGEHREPASDVAELVDAVMPPPWELGPTWMLYRVLHPEVVPTVWEAVAGGAGGAPIMWNCPRGMALSGVVATSTPDGQLVGSVQPRCRNLEVRGDGVVAYGARREMGPRFGNAAPHQRKVLECVGAQLFVGFEGGHGAFVDRVGVACAEARRVTGDEDGVEERIDLAEVDADGRGEVGGAGGEPFHLVCPPDSVPVGLRGGFGYMIDSVGVACGPIRGVLDDGRSLAPHASLSGPEPPRLVAPEESPAGPVGDPDGARAPAFEPDAVGAPLVPSSAWPGGAQGPEGRGRRPAPPLTPAVEGRVPAGPAPITPRPPVSRDGKKTHDPQNSVAPPRGL